MDVEGNSSGQIGVLFQYFPGLTEVNNENPFMMAGVLA
jgi:hypothetical protein